MAIRTPLSSPQAARTLLIVGLIAMSVMIRCEAGVPGDINNDGVLNNLDILAAQAHCIGLSERLRGVQTGRHQRQRPAGRGRYHPHESTDRINLIASPT